MLNLICAVVYVIVAFLLCRIVMKPLGTLPERRKMFSKALLFGALPCALAIIVLEIAADSLIFGRPETLGGEILTSFLRAALIEEGVKYGFCLIVLRKFRPAEKTEAMLLCGMIGAGYGLIEKLALGGGAIMLVNSVLPLHIFFQFLMGAFLFDARQAAEAGDISRGRGKSVLAFFLPFLVHGLWDSLLSVAGWLMEGDDVTARSTVGLLLFFALAAGGIVIEIKVLKRMRKKCAVGG